MMAAMFSEMRPVWMVEKFIYRHWPHFTTLHTNYIWKNIPTYMYLKYFLCTCMILYLLERSKYILEMNSQTLTHHKPYLIAALYRKPYMVAWLASIYTSLLRSNFVSVLRIISPAHFPWLLRMFPHILKSPMEALMCLVFPSTFIERHGIHISS